MPVFLYPENKRIDNGKCNNHIYVVVGGGVLADCFATFFAFVGNDKIFAGFFNRYGFHHATAF